MTPSGQDSQPQRGASVMPVSRAISQADSRTALPRLTRPPDRSADSPMNTFVPAIARMISGSGAQKSQ